ncbi:MAG TPA: DUF45 domain-containing protein, partial [Tepidiformaceae bacterium]|nr:DUF45 domain-containing protein [Tepidiformaceae bacterium]
PAELMRVAGRPLTTAQLTVEVAGQPVAVTVIRSSNRRRTIAVGIGPGGIRVQAPVATSESAVLELLQQRQAWLVRHLQADSLRKSALELATGSRMLFRGEHLTLRVETAPGRRPPARHRPVRHRVDALVGDQPKRRPQDALPHRTGVLCACRGVTVACSLLHGVNPTGHRS